MTSDGVGSIGFCPVKSFPALRASTCAEIPRRSTRAALYPKHAGCSIRFSRNREFPSAAKVARLDSSYRFQAFVPLSAAWRDSLPMRNFVFLGKFTRHCTLLKFVNRFLSGILPASDVHCLQPTPFAPPPCSDRRDTDLPQPSAQADRPPPCRPNCNNYFAQLNFELH